MKISMLLCLVGSFLISIGISYNVNASGNRCFEAVQTAITKPQDLVIPKNITQKIAKFSRLKKPKVLMGAVEFLVEINGETYISKVGGLGVVMKDMYYEVPAYLKSIGGGEFGLVIPRYKEIPIDGLSLFAETHIQVGNNREHVKIYMARDSKTGGINFIADSNAIRMRSIKNPYTNPDNFVLTGRADLEEKGFYSLFSQVIAFVNDTWEPDVLHTHDYHTAMAPIYAKHKSYSSLTIHNAGPGYQGEVFVPNYGIGRDYSNPKYANGVPTGDFMAMDYILKVFNIDFDTYMKYFESYGSFNMLSGAIKYNVENGLVGGQAVSGGYARELAIYWKMLDGIENGLGDLAKAFNHKGLKKLGKNFGHDLISLEGIAFVHKTKSEIKEMAQKRFGLEVDPNKPLITLLTRLVDQKAVDVLAESIGHIVFRGGQVLIAGVPGDASGHAVANRLRALQAQYPNQVHFSEGFLELEEVALIQGGGDFTVLTSKFEPCGLTDIESSWLGTVVISRKIGGLGKTVGFFYEWQDISDVWGQSQRLNQEINVAFDMYYTKKQDYLNMRVEAMKQDFSWPTALGRYFGNYDTAGIQEIVNAVNSDLYFDQITEFQGQDIITKFFKTLNEKQIANYVRMLKLKGSSNLFESYILKTYGG